MERFGVDLVLTSARDGEHMKGSLHDTGEAFDARSKHLPRYVKHEVLAELRLALGNQFDVLFEYEGMPREHFHIEHDAPGTIRVPQEGTMPVEQPRAFDPGVFFAAAPKFWIIAVSAIGLGVSAYRGYAMTPEETATLTNQGFAWFQAGVTLITFVMGVFAQQQAPPDETLKLTTRAMRS